MKNRKKKLFEVSNSELPSWMCLFQSKILQRFSVHFSKNACFFLQKPYIILNLHLSTYQISKKILWDRSNNTEKINLRVALFLEHKPKNLPSNSHFNLSNATLRYACSYFIWNDIVSNLYHMYLYHMYLSLLKTYMGKENLFNTKLLAFYVISLSTSLFVTNNSFVGNNKLYQYMINVLKITSLMGNCSIII